MADDWLTSRACLDLLTLSLGENQAKLALRNRAAWSMIRAKALRLIRTQGGFAPYVQDDAPIEPKFFAAADFYGNWDLGDFSARPGLSGHWQVIGLHFERAGIEKMLPVSAHRPSLGFVDINDLAPKVANVGEVAVTAATVRDEAVLTAIESSTPAPPVKPPSPLSGPALGRWWTKLGDRRDGMSLNALWAAAKVAHPGKQISRQRIRALAPDRKPGPKPFGRNRTAELPLK